MVTTTPAPEAAFAVAMQNATLPWVLRSAVSPGAICQIQAGPFGLEMVYSISFFARTTSSVLDFINLFQEFFPDSILLFPVYYLLFQPVTVCHVSCVILRN